MIDEYDFKEGDIIVRCYDNGRRSIFLYQDFTIGKNDLIFYLGEDFDDDGGLKRFEDYCMGNYKDDKYKYEYASFVEIKSILNSLITFRSEIPDMIFSRRHKYRDIDNIINKVSLYLNKIRKDKLNSINNRI